MQLQTDRLTTERLTPDRIMQIGMGFWASKTLLSAVELGVFTALAGAPADLETLRATLGMHPRAARDFLDALVALGLLTRTGGLYANAADADRFLDRDKPTYVGGVLEMSNARLYGFWGSLTEALRTGAPQNEAKEGGDVFSETYANPARLRSFLGAMSGLSAGSAAALAQKFDWSDRQTFADIGAAQGMVPATLATAHRHLNGVGFDLPAVRPVFEEFVTGAGLSDRVSFQGGSFFEDPLPHAEVLIMGHILHDWDLAEKKILLRKAYETLPDGGALIVYEAMIDDDRRENAFGLLMSLNMLIETQGGFDFTAADCRAWMAEAGFRETRVEPLAGPDSMVVGLK